MKAIYFNRNFQINVQDIETTAGQTLVFTTLEEMEHIKIREKVINQKIDMAADFMNILNDLRVKGKLNKTILKALGW